MAVGISLADLEHHQSLATPFNDALRIINSSYRTVIFVYEIYIIKNKVIVTYIHSSNCSIHSTKWRPH